MFFHPVTVYFSENCTLPRLKYLKQHGNGIPAFYALELKPPRLPLARKDKHGLRKEMLKTCDTWDAFSLPPGQLNTNTKGGLFVWFGLFLQARTESFRSLLLGLGLLPFSNKIQLIVCVLPSRQVLLACRGLNHGADYLYA